MRPTLVDSTGLLLRTMKKYLAPLILSLATAYYYITSIELSFEPMPIQVGLVAAIGVLSIIACALCHDQIKQFISRGLIVFLLACIIISIATTNVALLSMCSIGIAYHLAYKGAASRELIKHLLIINTIFFVSVMILCLVGILPNNEAAIYYMPGLSTSVYALGFQNPNGVLMLLLPIIASAVLYASDMKPARRYLVLSILALVSIAFFAIAGSRNGFIVILLVIIAGLIGDALWDRVKKPILGMAPAAFSIFAVLSFVLVLLFGKEWDNPVNKILSFRPSKMFEAVSGFMENPVWLSSQELSGIPVDNLYIFIALSYGILILIGYAFVFWRLFRAERDVRVVVIGLLMLLYGVFEKFTMIPVINIFMILAIVTLLNKPSNNYLEASRGKT